MGKFKAQVKMIDGEKWLKFDSEFERVRYYHGNKIMAIVGIALMIFMFILGFVLFTHIHELKDNPFVYGLSKLNVEGSCTCTFADSEGTNYLPFHANSTSWWYEDEGHITLQGRSFNWSAYNGSKG